MRIVTLVLLFVLAWLLVRHVYTQHSDVLSPVTSLVESGLMGAEEVARVTGLRDVLQNVKQSLRRPYRPSQWGYGGMDPAGGERKGGNGRGIPDAVSVGWWNGPITYPQRSISPVTDAEQPKEAQIVDVGWWGDDWVGA